jgi:hypothetical protein
VGDRRSERGDGRDADIRPGTRCRAGGGEDEHRQPDVPEHEAHEATQQRGDEAPEADRDEEESMQALEYPVCQIECDGSTSRSAKSCRKRSAN